MAFAYCNYCKAELYTWKEASEPCEQCGAESHLTERESHQYEMEEMTDRIDELEKQVTRLECLAKLRLVPPDWKISPKKIKQFAIKHCMSNMEAKEELIKRYGEE